jgi:hypothetical protein
MLKHWIERLWTCRKIDRARNEFPAEDGNTQHFWRACSVINERLRRKRAKAVSKFGKAITFFFACLDFMETFTMPSLQEMWIDLTANLNLMPILRKRGVIPPYRRVFFLIDVVFN